MVLEDDNSGMDLFIPIVDCIFKGLNSYMFRRIMTIYGSFIHKTIII